MPSTVGTSNPVMEFDGMSQSLRSNINAIAKDGDWAQEFKRDTSDIRNLIFDISMETGTGKTYAYTKTMLELNKHFGITKFIVAVPRVAIKAGTVNFLKSEAGREHFCDEFDRDIKVYEVKAQKARKGKKEYMPQAVSDFCLADTHMNRKAIHVLVINSGMITSKTMEKAFDVALFDEFNVPHEAIANTRPVLIIDEPHTFKRGTTTFKKLMRFNPQFTLRYGATFDGDLTNLVYELTAVEAFNQDLVKGITVHLEKFDEGEDAAVRFVNSDGNEGTFELRLGDTKTNFKLSQKDSFETVHPEMTALTLDKLNKSTAVLSNGLELKKGDRINPYSYAETLQEKMVQQAIVTHFELERELFLQSPRIKALSLFFIDHIESYRDDDGALRVLFEGLLSSHLKSLIAKETNPNYKAHLETALSDLAALHAGDFSQDNSDSDEKIEQETLEILHDKETLLEIDNPRRFIFSKWTLREGWDNPNVFLICKLRSSGSETSKLQEVGRGLRLPGNEFKARDRSKSHDLHYFVDFTEKRFAQTLTDEINSKSGIGTEGALLGDQLIAKILEKYPAIQNENALLADLNSKGIINFVKEFQEDGFVKLTEEYPLAFIGGLKKGKVKKAGDQKKTTAIRKGKYAELKALWEQISEKVVLEYDVNEEADFETLFEAFLKAERTNFKAGGVTTEIQKLRIQDELASFQTEESISAEILPFRMMKYSSFVKEVAFALSLSVTTVHNVFLKLKNDGFSIEDYMNQSTIRRLKVGLNHYLMQHAFGKFSVGFKKTRNSIHPTSLTKPNGEPLEDIRSSEVGRFFKDGAAPTKYMFEDVFYDSDLELTNIEKPNVEEIVVFSKIPKNSVRIPLVGGGTYSPDFAYVVRLEGGQKQFNLIVETKGKDQIDLSEQESLKIKHAETYFNQHDGRIRVVFRKQLKAQKMIDIIKEASGSQFAALN